MSAIPGRSGPILTLNFGLRYIRDTGRTDSDLASIPCSAVSPALLAAGYPGCSGDLLDQWGPGLGNAFGNRTSISLRQIGFAWDPWHDGKTSIRGGGGLYYENNIFNNVSYDRSDKLATGLFNQTPYLNCEPGGSPGSLAFALPGPGGTQNLVTSVDSYDLATQVCFAPLGPSSINAEGAAKSMARPANRIHCGHCRGWCGRGKIRILWATLLELGYPYYPNFRTARSYQMNIGIQRAAHQERRPDGRLPAQYRSAFSDWSGRKSRRRFPLSGISMPPITPIAVDGWT